jgi:hypothetical protein
MRLDGHFLKADLYEYASGEQRLDIVYLDSLDKREVILTEHFASQELLYKAFVETPSSRYATLTAAVAERDLESRAMAVLITVRRCVSGACATSSSGLLNSTVKRRG